MHPLAARRTVALLLAATVLASSILAMPLGSPTRGAASSVIDGRIAPGSLNIGPTHLVETVRPSFAAGIQVPTVLETLFPNYNGSLPGNFPSTVFDWQVGTPAVVPALDELWLPQLPVTTHGLPPPASAPAVVYNMSSNSFAGLVPSLSNISALTFDATNGYLYGSDPLNNTVEVFDPSHQLQVGRSIPVGTDPVALTFDPSSQYVFTANRGSNNVTVINCGTETVSYRGVSVGVGPAALADDSRDGLVYVANGNESSLSILSAANPTTVEPTVPLTFGPASDLAYSPAAGTVAVTVPSSVNMTIIQAATKSVLSSLITVGLGFTAVTVNQNGSTFVLANSSDASLVTVDAYTTTVAAGTIEVGTSPSELVAEARSGWLLSWSETSREFTLVNLSARSAEGDSPTLAPLPSLQVFDPTSRQLAIADPSVPGIELLNATNGRSDGRPINLNLPVTGLSAGLSESQVYVGAGGSVSLLDAQTGVPLVRNTALPGPNGPILLDGKAGMLWVGRPGIDALVGLDAATLASEVKTPSILVDMSSAESIALDPLSNELFAVNASDGEIGVFNATSGHRISPDVRVGPNASALVFDSTDDLVYVAGASIDAIEPSTLSLAGNPIPLPPHASVGGLTYDSEDGILIVATSDTGGAGTLSEIDGSSYGVGASSAVTVHLGRNPTNPIVADAQAGALAGSSMDLVANTGSGTVSVVGRPPAISSFGFAPSTIDQGGTSEAIVSASGGAGSSTISYSGLPRGCASSNTLDLTCRPTANGTFAVSVTVTDALGELASTTATLTVGPALSASATFGSHTVPETDVGLPFPVSARAGGGEGAYQYAWQFGDGSSTTGAIAEHTFSSTGDYVVALTVSDSAGGSATVSQAVRVSAKPSAAIGVLPQTTVDAGVPASLTAVVTGGSDPGSGSWDFGDHHSATGLETSHGWGLVGGTPTTYQVNFSYEDAVGAYSNRSVTIHVDPALAGVFSVNAGSSSQVAPDSPLRFAADPTGGTPPYTVTWSFGDGNESTGLSLVHQYTAPGSYVVKVAATDAAGGSVNSTLAVLVVAEPATTASPYSGNFGPGLILGLVVGGAGAAVALYLAERSRRRPALQPPSPYVPPTRPRTGGRRP